MQEEFIFCKQQLHGRTKKFREVIDNFFREHDIPWPKCDYMSTYSYIPPCVTQQRVTYTCSHSHTHTHTHTHTFSCKGSLTHTQASPLNTHTHTHTHEPRYYVMSFSYIFQNMLIALQTARTLYIQIHRTSLEPISTLYANRS